MTQKPSILMLCHRIPYPPDKGDKIRAWHLLQHLATRYAVSLGCFIDDPADRQHCAIVDSICERTNYVNLNPMLARLKSLKALMHRRALSVDFYDHPAMWRWIAEVRAEGVLAEVAYSSTMAPYLTDAKAPVIMDLVDADSAKFAAYGREGRLHEKWIYGREGRKLAALESDLTHRADRVFLVSPEEASVVEALPSADPTVIDWYRNGVDTSYWRGDAEFSRAKTAYDIIFTGAMDYRPNIEAVVGFVREVWPQLKAVSPALTFGIVGARPTKEVLSLGHQPGVHVTGRVEDMRPYLVAAKVAVAPLAIARGVQNKVLEAMAMGTPVVASHAAITGTGAKAGEHVIEATGPEEMVAAITSLLDDPERAYRLSAAASSYITAEFPWSKTLQRFDHALAEALEGRTSNKDEQ